MKYSKITALLLALMMVFTTVGGTVFAEETPAPVCMTEDELKADFEAAAAAQFGNVGTRPGVYIGKYDEDNHEVTVAILDGTKGIMELKNTGLFAGLDDLYRNHNLVKVQIGDQDVRDLKAIEGNVGPANFMQAMAAIVGSDIGDELNETVPSLEHLSDFIGQSITLKLTVGQEGCNNEVTIDYKVSGKEADSVTLAGKLQAVDIGAFVDDDVNWKEGVALNDDNQGDADLQAILDAAIVTDKTDPARTTDTANEAGAEGTLLVTFPDGSTLEVPNQKLYVYEEGAKAPEGKLVPSNGAVVNFTRDEKSIEDFGEVDPIIVKKGTTLKDSQFPAITEKEGYYDAVWTPKKDTVINQDTTFTASAWIEKVIPYKPNDPKNPTNSQDSGIPQIDRNGKDIHQDLYFIVAMKTESNRRGTLRKGGITNDVISVLVKKGEGLTFNDIKAQVLTKDGYEFSHWDKNGKVNAFENKTVADGDIFTAHFDRKTSGIVTPPETDDKPTDQIHGTHAAYLQGYPDGTIMPDGSITRAESATIIAKLKGLSLNDTSKPAFSDTPSGWYNGAINAVVEANLMRGYPDGTFRPNEKISRAEFAQMIKSIDLPNNMLAPFSDVKGHWAEAAINQAYGNGRIQGYPDGMFRPNASITRAEAVTISNKLFDRKVDDRGLRNKLENPRALRTFKDLPETHWAYHDILEASNSHDFQRRDRGKVMEDWTNIN